MDELEKIAMAKVLSGETDELTVAGKRSRLTRPFWMFQSNTNICRWKSLFTC